MKPIELRIARQKREDLADYVTRVIIDHCSSEHRPTREDEIKEALEYYRGAIVDWVQEQERSRHASETRRLDARFSELLRKHTELKSNHQRLTSASPRTVTVREAEEARLGAARWMREKAATHFENPGGEPTATSEAIRSLPEPRPKWGKS